jgi:hypothetical protein
MPVTGNITQSAYAVANVLTFAAGRVLMRVPERRLLFAESVVVLSLLNAAAAVLNVIEHYTGMPSLLELVRTAYATTHQSFGSMARIQGTFPAASAFSGFSLCLFAFTFQLWLDKLKVRYTGLATGASLLFLLFSTSGTAYAGLSIYFTVLIFALFRRAAERRTTPRLAWVLAAAPLVLSLVQLLVVLDSPILGEVADFLNRTFLQKMDSDSGRERGSWNEAAWDNFLDTYGLGLGIGSVRTSSFAMTLLSNLGGLGTLLYLAFLVQLFRAEYASRSGPPSDLEVVRGAARHAVLASLGAACVSATVFDLGIGFYLFAAAASLPVERRHPASTSAPLQHRTAAVLHHVPIVSRRV